MPQLIHPLIRRLSLCTLALAPILHLQGQINLIPPGAIWYYAKGTTEASNPTSEWRNQEFQAIRWYTSPLPLHYGDNLTSGQELTDMRGSYSCVFLRHPFTIQSPAALGELELVVDYDDGFVAWLNGTEIARHNVSGDPAFDDVASGSHEGGSPVSFVLAGSASAYLTTGENVLAIQAFNVSLSGSSDFRIDASLRAVQAVDTAPFIAQQSPAPGPVSSLQQITISFNEPVVGLQPQHLLINDIPSLSAIPDDLGNTFTFTFNQPPHGTVHIAWNENTQLTDADGNLFDTEDPAASWSYTLLDSSPPEILKQTPAANSIVTRLDQIEITFTEPVTSLKAQDLLIAGSPATALTGSDAGPYQFTFASPAPGTVQLQWAANHAITDNATPPNPFIPASSQITLNPDFSPGSIHITEISTAGTTTLLDEDLETSDWIELHNNGPTPVNLIGWSLSDDPNEPDKWTFPSQTLNPNAYLVVFASGKDRPNPAPGRLLHTNFKLSAFGEYLGLFPPDLPKLPASHFPDELPEQRPNLTYGLTPDEQWAYYNTPTPGAPNPSSTLTTIAPIPHTTVPRGIFNAPFQVSLSSPLPNAEIRYTTDGSLPTPSSPPATNPIPITQTTTLRAITFAPNSIPSQPLTCTYIQIQDVVQQSPTPPDFPSSWGSNSGFPGGLIPADYEMDHDPLRTNPSNPGSQIDPAKLTRLQQGLLEIPTVSVVLNQDDMFGPGGLYPSASDGNKTPNEKPCSVEMILPDGSTAFAITAGIDLHGNASRNPLKNPKHGFKLTFKKDFGPTKLNYPLFPDSAITEFDDLILRADFNSSWRHWSDVASNGTGAYQRTRATRTRYAWGQDTFRDMGHSSPHTLFFHLYINGLYWGTYDFGEQPTEQFAEASFGPSEDGYDVYDQGGLRDGTSTAYNRLLALSNLEDNANYEQAKQFLDVTEFIDYMLMHFYIGHQDWGNNKNWYAIRPRVPGANGTFRYLPWDQECILLEENINRVPNGGGSTDVPSGLHTKLDDNEQYRLDFADRVFHHMIAPNGALTPEANIARWQKWTDIMNNPIVAESCRWGDYRRDVHPYSNGSYELYTREDQWIAENNRMTQSYFLNRSDIVLQQFRTAGLYPTLNAPTFSQHGGTVAAGYNLSISAPSGTVYYTLDGSDPRTYGTGAISPQAIPYSNPIPLSQSALVKARTKSGSTWSALNSASFTIGHILPTVRITEIMYHHPTSEGCEYFEIHNLGPIPVDLSHASFQGVDLVLPANTTMPPGAVWVLASSSTPSAFADCYPTTLVTAWFNGSLDNAGERLALIDRNGRTITAVHYDDENGWPTDPDGNGPSLQIIDPFGDPNAPANWQASPINGGSPGIPQSAPPLPRIVLNEIMAENLTAVPHANTHPDWIELANRTDQDVPLDGWGLSDDSNPWKFTFPPGSVLPANGFLVVWCDTANTPGLHTGFALSRKGDSILLHDAVGLRIDGLTFGNQLPDLSLGRTGTDNAWTLNTPTPGEPNTPTPTTPATSLHINEWLANAAAGESDWVELFNDSPTLPANIQGLTLNTTTQYAPIQSISFIPPQGFLQLLADEQPGPNHLELKLPAEGSVLQLIALSGQILDELAYGPQTEATSQGRLPDGSGSIQTFTLTISPGASNYLTPLNSPVINEIMARNRNTVANPWGHASDWIELYNPYTFPLSLADMQLRSSDTTTTTWTFPPNSTLAPGEFKTIWCDNSTPPTSQSQPDWNTGFNLNGSYATVELLSPQGQVLDSVQFGPQIANASIGIQSGQWTLLAYPTPGSPNAPVAATANITTLKINEWMAAPLTGSDWFELFNPATLPANLSDMFLSDNPSISTQTNTHIPHLTFIAPQSWLLWTADGKPAEGPAHANFQLNQDGDSIFLYTPELELVDSVQFGPQSPNTSQGRLLDGSDSLLFFPDSASPGQANYLPLQNIVINELLAHTDPPLEDAVELLNTGNETVNLSGWFLSDNPSDPRKFQLPPDTWLDPNQTLVVYQYQFGTPDNEVEAPPRFNLSSAYGESLTLCAADEAGNLTGHRTSVNFGATANGVSYGQIPTSTGFDLAPLLYTTFGQDSPNSLEEFRLGSGLPNSQPLIGPILISEIFYAPNNTSTNSSEFVELWNTSNQPTPLYDPELPENTWQLTGAIHFQFPPATTIPANSTLLVLPFNPETEPDQLATFLLNHPEAQTITGPYTGSLNNSGETLELLRPDTPQPATAPDAGFIPYILVERVSYSPLPPWPTPTNSTDSLQRIPDATAYANDPTSWMLTTTSAGTPPIQSPQPQPTLQWTEPSPGSIQIQFQTEANTSYSLLYSPDLNSSPWSKLTDVPAHDSPQTITITDNPTTARFYLLVSPAVP